jgi:hypothetical protein
VLDDKPQEQVNALAVRCPVAPKCRWDGVWGLLTGHIGQECRKKVAFVGYPVRFLWRKL